MPFKLETQRKRCPPHLLPRAWSLEGSQTPLPSLLCYGRGWQPFLLTSDDSEPYFPKVAEESGGARRPSRAPGPAGVTGNSCPLPKASARPTSPELGACPQPITPPPPGAPPLRQGKAAGRGGVTLACTRSSPLCTQWACPPHTPSWPDWKQKMTKSVFFF